MEAGQGILARVVSFNLIGRGNITDTSQDMSILAKHRMPMVAPIASATSTYKKGRKFLFSVSPPPPDTWFEGLTALVAWRDSRRRP